MSLRHVLAGLIALVLVAPAHCDDKSQEQREKDFSERMTKTVLIGAFTVDGQKLESALKEERYEIKSVQKSSSNVWVFTARVKYMKFDATLPIPVPVEWAGDTPVVSLTDAKLPGLGDGFSCRVIFHEDRYAGTWQHGEFGGHMFGRIEKQKATNGAVPSSEQAPAPSE